MELSSIGDQNLGRTSKLLTRKFGRKGSEGQKSSLQGAKGLMKKARLPLPVLILISATLFLFSSSFGEWIARPSSLPTPPRETTEQQEAAVVYVRAMSWVAQLISHTKAHSKMDAESAQSDDSSPVSTREMPAHRIQICALSKLARPSRSLCKSWQFTIQYPPHSLARLNAGQRTTDN